MRRIKFLYLYLVVIAFYALALTGRIGMYESEAVPSQGAITAPADASKDLAAKGAYLAKLGDCVSCHTAPGGQAFAGGLPINAPFGTIYSTNITPDREYGIGTYTLEDFRRALRQGIAKDGSHLYPAMPYPDFAAISDQDISALYEYFMHQVAPVHVQPPKTKLIFPFNQRWGIAFWDTAFLPRGRYELREDQDTQWNRGAYLVQSLGHCAACHTPRGLAYEEKGSPQSSTYLTGATLDNWYAPNLRSNAATGLGQWSEQDIINFLTTGHGGGAAAFGSMTQVVENSTQYLTSEDAASIAHYLKSLPAGGDEDASFHGNSLSRDTNERPGAGFYAVSCSSCHGQQGQGSLPGVPKLAGNPAILSEYPESLVRIVLEGGQSAKTLSGPKAEKMPAFRDKYTDAEMAEIVTYIRQSWGNKASAVTPRQVAKMREALKE